MLIISRRVGQRIMVGNDLEIVVTELSRRTVKLGIHGPAHTPVLRQEVWENIARSNAEAARSSFGAEPSPAALGGVGMDKVGP